jgi:hypothetical protein
MRWGNDFCHAVIDASLFWSGEDEEKCPALKFLRTMAAYYLWIEEGRPVP